MTCSSYSCWLVGLSVLGNCSLLLRLGLVAGPGLILMLSWAPESSGVIIASWGWVMLPGTLLSLLQGVLDLLVGLMLGLLQSVLLGL